MKNLKQTFRYMAMAFVSSFMLLPMLANAGSVTRTVPVELDCCELCPDNPTTKIFEGSSDTQYSITTEGIRVDGRTELIKILRSDRNYTKWYRTILKLPREVKTELLNLAKTDVGITAQCSSDTDYTDMWPVGTTLTCKKGDGLIVEQFHPDCQKDPDKHGVLTLRITKDTREKVDPLLIDLGRINLDQQLKMPESGLDSSSLFLGGIGFGGISGGQW